MFRFALAAAAALFSINSSAGALFTMVDESSAAKDRVELVVEGDSLTMQTDPQTTLIFQGQQERVLVVSHEDMSYMIVDRASAEKLVEEISPALEQMRKELERMPPDRRAMVEKMMGGRLRLSDAERKPEPVWDVQETGEDGEQIDIPCRWVDVVRDGALKQKVCVASTDDVPGAKQAIEGMRAMGSLFEEVLAPLRAKVPFQVPSYPVSNVKRLNGFPVITQDIENGTVDADLRLQSAREGRVDAAQFQPPEGYKARTLASR